MYIDSVTPRLPVICTDPVKDKPFVNLPEPDTSKLVVGVSVPTPTLDWDTNKAFCPNWPILTVLSEKASITGRPAAVFTENKDPDKESSTWKSLPDVPSTLNTLDPLP